MGELSEKHSREKSGHNSWSNSILILENDKTDIRILKTIKASERTHLQRIKLMIVF